MSKITNEQRDNTMNKVKRILDEIDLHCLCGTLMTPNGVRYTDFNWVYHHCSKRNCRYDYNNEKIINKYNRYIQHVKENKISLD